MDEEKRNGLTRMSWNGIEMERWTTPNDANHRNSHVLVQGVEFVRMPHQPYLARLGQCSATVSAYTTIQWDGKYGTEFIANVYSHHSDKPAERVLIQQFRELTWNDAFVAAAILMREKEDQTWNDAFVAAARKRGS